MTILTEIEAYLERNGIRPSMLGDHIVGDRALVARLRSGVNVRPATIDRIRRYMARYPDGGTAPRESRMKAKPRSRRDVVEEVMPPRVDRVPCWNCGTRGDIGCAHQPLG